MSRPRYERPEDLANERRAIDKLLAHLKPMEAQANKLPEWLGADYILSADGVATTVVEVKTRTNTHDRYPSIILDKGKYDKLSYLADMGFKAILLAQWSDRTGYTRIPVEYVEALGGRRDRGDHFDTGAMAYIGIDKFTFID